MEAPQGAWESAKIQLQIRNNAEEVNSFLKDVRGWTESMKVKDSEARRQKEADGELPPVRGRATAAALDQREDEDEPVKKSKKKKNKHVKHWNDGARVAEAHAAGHTYDYFRDKWDKFDLDAALAAASESSEDDEEAEEGAGAGSSAEAPSDNTSVRLTEVTRQTQLPSYYSSVSPAAAPEALPPAHVTPAARDSVASASLADLEKATGNDYFKKQEFELAALCYTRALEALGDQQDGNSRSKAVVLANRALCRLRLGDASAALVDGQAAVEADADYAKAWARLGMSRRATGELLEAIADFEKALALDCSLKDVRDALQATVSEYEVKEGLDTVRKSGRVSKRVVTLKRQEANVRSPRLAQKSSPSSVQRDTLEADASAHVDTGSKIREIEEPCAKAALVEPITKVAAPQSSRGAMARAKAKAEAAIEHLSLKTNEKLASTSTTVNASPFAADAPTIDRDGVSSKPDRAATVMRVEPAAAPCAEDARALGIRIPTTGAELELAWKEVKSDESRSRALVRALDPATLPTLLKQSLGVELLVGLALTCLRACTSGDKHALSVLESLPTVARFDMIRMFIVGKDKRDLSQAFDAAAASGCDVSGSRVSFKV